MNLPVDWKRLNINFQQIQESHLKAFPLYSFLL